jgi:hypothetical protein
VDLSLASVALLNFHRESSRSKATVDFFLY